MVVCSGRCFVGAMLGIGACMGLRALGFVNLGQILDAEKSTIKFYFKTVKKSDHIQYFCFHFFIFIFLEDILS
jgi:hypothetical protein